MLLSGILNLDGHLYPVRSTLVNLPVVRSIRRYRVSLLHLQESLPRASSNREIALPHFVSGNSVRFSLSVSSDIATLLRNRSANVRPKPSSTGESAEPGDDRRRNHMDAASQAAAVPLESATQDRVSSIG